MINDALLFLKKQLNSFLNAGRPPDEVEEELAQFINGERMEPVVFPLDAVSLLLINMEEETTLRPPDRYQRASDQGKPLRVQPPIRLNLYLLFVARFKDYERILFNLSRVIQFFQRHPVFVRETTPELPATIDRLVMELITLPFAQQNEVWSVLRATYHPSVIYKVKMVAFLEPEPQPQPQVETIELEVVQREVG
jgi:hypothetical protein